MELIFPRSEIKGLHFAAHYLVLAVLVIAMAIPVLQGEMFILLIPMLAAVVSLYMAAYQRAKNCGQMWLFFVALIPNINIIAYILLMFWKEKAPETPTDG